MCDCEIRIAIENDREAIANVLHEAFVEFESQYTREGFQATTPNAEQIHQRMCEGPVWVVTVNERICATVSVLSNGNKLYIRGMAVHPSFRGKGFARALLHHVQAFAIAASYEFLTLSTTPFLAAAISLYEQLGFVRSDQGPDHLFGTPLFTMVKKVE